MVDLSGFIFPIENMPAVIQPLTYLIPLRYFLIIVRSIFLKGVGLETLWPAGARPHGVGAGRPGPGGRAFVERVCLEDRIGDARLDGEHVGIEMAERRAAGRGEAHARPRDDVVNAHVDAELLVDVVPGAHARPQHPGVIDLDGGPAFAGASLHDILELGALAQTVERVPAGDSA